MTIDDSYQREDISVLDLKTLKISYILYIAITYIFGHIYIKKLILLFIYTEIFFDIFRIVYMSDNILYVNSYEALLRN